MHLLSTRPGGHVEDDGQGVVRVTQTPGAIVVLSAADTSLSLLAEAASGLDPGYPAVRLANLMWLRQPASIDLYVDDVLQHARVVVLDHLGSPSDWAYLVDRAMSLARERGQWGDRRRADQRPARHGQIDGGARARGAAAADALRHLAAGGQPGATGRLESQPPPL